MLCIPTRVVMAEDDPELVSAQARLRAQLASMRMRHEDATPGSEYPWRYLASAPYREDNGAITYVHVFCGPAPRDEASHVIGLPATRGWWPSNQPTVAPARTPSRARLRLVS